MTGYQHIKYATSPDQYRHVKDEVADKIARITLNRPDHVNVQSTIMLEELDHAIDLAGHDDRFVLQAVHMIKDGAFQRPWKADERRWSRLVFIGRELDEGALRSGFDACRA